MMTNTNEQCSLTPEEHWKLHQGVWKTMGCNMVLYSKFYKYKYTYYTTDKRVEKVRWIHEHKSLG